MYTNSIIGSYNQMASIEQGPWGRMNRPPGMKKPQTPKKTLSKESTVMSPVSVATNSSVEIPQVLPGLETLTSLLTVVILPSQTEEEKVGYSISLPDNQIFLKCLRQSVASRRNASLQLQSMEDTPILDIKRDVPFCCPWFRNHVTRILIPEKNSSNLPFATFIKSASGLCGSSHHYNIEMHKEDQSSSNYDLDILTTQPEIHIKHKNETILTTSLAKSDAKTWYTINFVAKKEEELMRINTNLKAMLVLLVILILNDEE